MKTRDMAAGGPFGIGTGLLTALPMLYCRAAKININDGRFPEALLWEKPAGLCITGLHLQHLGRCATGFLPMPG